MDNMKELAKIVAETVKAETDKVRAEMAEQNKAALDAQEKAFRDSCASNKYFNPETMSGGNFVMVPNDAEKKAFNAGGLMRSIASVAARKQGIAPQDYAQKNFAQDEMLIKALGTDTGAAGGFLLPQAVSNELIELLRAKSIVRLAGPRVITIDNTMDFTKVTGGATAYWIGENQAITESQQTLGQVRAELKTVAALTPVNNRLLNSKSVSVSAETMIRDDFVKCIATAQDVAFLRGPGTAYAPKGMRYWGTSAGSSTTPVTFTSQIADLWTLISTLGNANVSVDKSECAFFAPGRTEASLMKAVSSTGVRVFADTLSTGKLEGYPAFFSGNLPITLTPGTASELMFANMTDVILAEGEALRIDISDQATWVSGGVTYSCFQNNASLIRVLQDVDLVARHAESIAYFSDVIWT